MHHERSYLSMDLTKLFAEVQANPRSTAAYRRLAEHYERLGQSNEAAAFRTLIDRKSDAHSSDGDARQRVDGPGGD